MGDFQTQSKMDKAKKEHRCDAYAQILEAGMFEDEFNPDDWEELQAMKEKKGRIQVGETYVSWSGVYCGDFYHCKANKEMLDICERYDLWGDL